MIRIFLPLIMAVVAFFGVWDTSTADSIAGFDLAEPTTACLLDLNPSISGECAPQGDISDQLVTYTILGGGAAAVLSVLGLLPLIGRLTALTTLAAGGIGVAAAVMALAGALGGGGLAGVGWGVWATMGAGFVTALSGIFAFRGGE